jgi:glycerol-3-phosphate dehydrogenase
LDIGIVGGGINGLCSAWMLARNGHTVTLYERNEIMSATSCSSSKLLHGGLRYLENGEYRLVREALRERDDWLRRAPEHTRPLRLVIPIYRNSRRSRWLIALGLWLYDHMAGRTILPRARSLRPEEILQRDTQLDADGLECGYEFWDGMMDDAALGRWVAEQAKRISVRIREHTEAVWVTKDGTIGLSTGETKKHDMLINAAGPWACKLLEQSGIQIPYQLDLVRGSHLILAEPFRQAYLLEVPNSHRIFFVLPWQGQTLVGTTEVRQSLDVPIACGQEEMDYLLSAWQHYFPSAKARVVDTFSGVRPLIYSSSDPSRATREYLICKDKRLITVLGGKWTTAMALAHKVARAIH